jgi:preprotein translocase subunit SecE
VSDKERTAESKLDQFKWVLVTAIVVIGIYGNSYFAAESVLYRAIALLVLAGIAGWIASQTSKGAAFVTLCLEARTEIRKVVWPNRTETTHTTMIVVAVVLVVALILWALDSLLSWLITMIIG